MAVDPREETLRLLTSMDATLKQILAALRPSESAPSVDLDGQHGDPVVKQKDPRDWTGDSMKGRRFSECPAEYLDILADRFEYFAGKEPDATKQKYNRLDAARARGWAARVRAGHVPAAPVQTAPMSAAEVEW